MRKFGILFIMIVLFTVSVFQPLSASKIALEIHKSADPPTEHWVEMGTPIQYFIEYHNPATTPAHDVVITDTISNKIAYVYDVLDICDSVKANPGPPIVITWYIGEVDTGVVDAVSYKAMIRDDIVSPYYPLGYIFNKAYIDASDMDGLNSNTTVHYIARPNMGLEKESKVLGGGQARPGSVIEYTIGYWNADQITEAYNVETADMIDPFIESVFDISGPCVVDPGPPITIIWYLGVVEYDTVKYVSYKARVRDDITGVDIAGIVENFASCRWEYELNVYFCDSYRTFDTIFVAAKLDNFRMKANPPSGYTINAGDTIAYQIMYENTGDGIADDAFLTDPISGYIDTVFDISGNGIFSFGKIEWELGDLLPGDADTFSYQVVIKTDFKGTIGTISNYAILNANNFSKPCYSDTTLHYIEGGPTFSGEGFLKTASPVDSSTILPGSDIKYYIFYKNLGNVKAKGVVIDDTLDTDIERLIDISPGGHTTIDRVIRWNIGDVEPGESDSVYFWVKVKDNFKSKSDTLAVVRNRSVIYGSNFKSTFTNSVVHYITKQVDFNSIGNFVKSAIPPSNSVVFKEQSIEYTIHFKNTGNDTADNVYIKDPIDDNLSVINIGSNGYQLENEIIWSLGNIAPYEEGSVSYTGVVKDSFKSKSDTIGLISNYAFIYGDNVSQVYSDTVVHYVCEEAGVEIYPDITENIFNGDTITYTLYIGNQGFQNDVFNIISKNSSTEFNILILNSSDNLLEDTDGDGLVDIGNLAPEHTAVIKLQVIAPAEGELTDTTIITAKSSIDTMIQDSAVIITKVVNRIVDVAINPDYEERIRGNESKSYILTVENNGNSKDVVDIIFERTNNGWLRSILGHGGKDLLDNNGNGISDVKLNPGEDIVIFFNTTPPFGFIGSASESFVDTAIVFAVSSIDRGVKDSAVIITKVIPEFIPPHNFPNPFSKRTTFIWNLSEKSFITLEIYTRAGELVKTLLDGDKIEVGHGEIKWYRENQKGKKVAPGVYIYIFKATGEYGFVRTVIKKLLVLP